MKIPTTTSNLALQLHAAAIAGDMPLGQTMDCLYVALHIDRLWEACQSLAAWVDHHDRCDVLNGGGQCTCGLERAAAPWRELKRAQNIVEEAH